MNEKRTAITAVPGRVEIDGQPPPLMIPPREEAAHVVRAGNNPVSRDEIVTIGFVIFVAAVVVTIAMYLTIVYLAQVADGWRAAAISIAIGALSFVGLNKYALPYITGDNVAEKEIRESYRTERQRIAENAGLWHGWLNLEAAKENNRHEEKMLALTNEQIALDVGHRMSAIEDSQRRLLDVLQPRADVPMPARESSFVPSKPRPARGEARAFVESLYDEDGKPDASKVHANGALKVAAPWRKKGGQWAQKDWGASAKRILMDGHGGEQPLIVPVLDVSGKA